MVEGLPVYLLPKTLADKVAVQASILKRVAVQLQRELGHDCFDHIFFKSEIVRDLANYGGWHLFLLHRDEIMISAEALRNNDRRPYRTSGFKWHLALLGWRRPQVCTNTTGPGQVDA